MKHIPDIGKMVSDTPRTEAAYAASTGAGIYELFKESQDIERELNAANERIEAINRGNANAERILCELTGCESGRDIPDWILKKNCELTDLAKAYLELVHKHTLANERIKRLEDVGDKMKIYCDTILARDWKEAKEAKS